MPEEPISYAELMAVYESAQPQPNPIVRYEIDEYGVVHLLREDGSWGGMTSREGLQSLLDNQPKDENA